MVVNAENERVALSPSFFLFFYGFSFPFFCPLSALNSNPWIEVRVARSEGETECGLFGRRKVRRPSLAAVPRHTRLVRALDPAWWIARRSDALTGKCSDLLLCLS